MISSLYVISEGVDGPVKIGRSNNPHSRVATLQTGNARPLILTAIYDMIAEDVCAAEKMLHEELADFSILGEWFSLTERFMQGYMPDFIKANGFEVLNGAHQNR